MLRMIAILNGCGAALRTTVLYSLRTLHLLIAIETMQLGIIIKIVDQRIN
jgi:hypothetical protein